ncbi:MAG: hypothetical protein ATN35_03390 [Epulopiscium sp. Nele67-Bin004]|nr:MAG: hypothetical protein ATN35_03390 [Epulopiscium sp. Nele67-Bin004]
MNNKKFTAMIGMLGISVMLAGCSSGADTVLASGEELGEELKEEKIAVKSVEDRTEKSSEKPSNQELEEDEVEDIVVSKETAKEDLEKLATEIAEEAEKLEEPQVEETKEEQVVEEQEDTANLEAEQAAAEKAEAEKLAAEQAAAEKAEAEKLAAEQAAAEKAEAEKLAAEQAAAEKAEADRIAAEQAAAEAVVSKSLSDLYIGMIMTDEIIAGLGTPTQQYTAPSCHGSGTDTIYIYPNFGLNIYENDGSKLYIIELYNANVSTPQGAKVGMSKAEIISIYGSSYDEFGTIISYTTGGQRYDFTLDGNGIVTFIEIF